VVIQAVMLLKVTCCCTSLQDCSVQSPENLTLLVQPLSLN
jgi:hypothetical protein